MMLRKLKTISDPFKSLCQRNEGLSGLISILRQNSTEGPSTESVASTSSESPKKNINKAMKAYLERAQEHEDFMKKQREEFQIGKRHLANMMGENPETFTQDDIDNAIEYLFPSGLYEKRARPFMKPPEEVFPQRKAAEFDETGRPFHFLFYTGKPNFYQVLYDAVEHMNELNRFEDVMIRKGLEPDPNLKLELSGYQWLDKESVEKRLVETVADRDYDSLINALERLSQLPYAYKVKDFIFQYMIPLMSQIKTIEAPKPQYDTDGRAYITVYECLRKRARGDVTIRSPGTGKISINGSDITYFEDVQCREQLVPTTSYATRSAGGRFSRKSNGVMSGRPGGYIYGPVSSCRYHHYHHHSGQYQCADGTVHMAR